MAQLMVEELKKKWAPVLEHKDASPITDRVKSAHLARLLENQETFLKEAAPENNYSDGNSNIKSWDPVLISLVRRAMPNLIAYDICSVQPMSQPTGLIFAMKARYGDGTADLTDNTEALFNEADTHFGGAGSQSGTDPAVLNDASPGTYTYGTGMTTAAGEALGDGVGADFASLGFTIDKVTVSAKTRALKAEYTMELQQDLKAVHGLDAETELANILTAEILAEINREVIRTIYVTSTIGAQNATTATAGIFDLDIDSNGRWSVEKFKGLMFHLEREANEIAKQTRRGRGNIIICSSNVASALAMAGTLDYAPAIQANLSVDDTGNTFAGVLNGRYKVYIDPYFVSSAGNEFAVVGYKGASPYDAGLFYCPYVPLQMVRAVGQNSFQPKIAFKTRYGMVSNPFANSSGTQGALTANVNKYYRKLKIKNLM
jgi:hypothetical protein